MDTDAWSTQTINLSGLAEHIVRVESERGTGRSFVQAIKLFRVITRLGLREAKDYCDNAVRDLGIGSYVDETCTACNGKGSVQRFTRGF
jgi:hypothetical protein